MTYAFLPDKKVTVTTGGKDMKPATLPGTEFPGDPEVAHVALTWLEGVLETWEDDDTEIYVQDLEDGVDFIWPMRRSEVALRALRFVESIMDNHPL